jgi:hypothetical protein
MRRDPPIRDEEILCPPIRDEERATSKRQRKTHQKETRKDLPIRDEERPTNKIDEERPTPLRVVERPTNKRRGKTHH